MGTIAIKRVYDPPQADDGFRVLVDRLWPRGLTKAAAALNLWAKELAPSPALRKAFNHRPERFAEFARHYRAELAKNPAVAGFRSWRGHSRVTLLYGAHDRQNNHAVVLADFLRKNAKAKKPAKKPAAKKPVARKKAKKKARPQSEARRRSR
jgi:uncharacterized protein YeaO (DUF488 family)